MLSSPAAAHSPPLPYNTPPQNWIATPHITSAFPFLSNCLPTCTYLNVAWAEIVTLAYVSGWSPREGRKWVGVELLRGLQGQSGVRELWVGRSPGFREYTALASLFLFLCPLNDWRAEERKSQPRTLAFWSDWKTILTVKRHHTYLCDVFLLFMVVHSKYWTHFIYEKYWQILAYILWFCVHEVLDWPNHSGKIWGKH